MDLADFVPDRSFCRSLWSWRLFCFPLFPQTRARVCIELLGRLLLSPMLGVAGVDRAAPGAGWSAACPLGEDGVGLVGALAAASGACVEQVAWGACSVLTHSQRPGCARPHTSARFPWAEAGKASRRLMGAASCSV